MVNKGWLFNEFDKGFLNTYIFKVFYTAAATISWSLFPLYLLKSGFSYMDITLYFLFVFVATLVTSLLIRKQNARDTIRQSIIMRIVMIVLVLYIMNKAQVYVAGILYGVFMVYFWNTYNIEYFSYSKKSSIGIYSGLFFATSPIIGIVLSPVTGYIAESFGYWLVFLLGIPLYALAMARFNKLDQMTIKYDLTKALKRMKGVRTLLIIEGIWQAVPFVIIPLFTLYFIKSELNYGFFLGFMCLLGAVASITAGRISDTMKNRSIFIYPVILLLAVFTVLSAFSKTIFAWMALVGIASFLREIASPFMTVVILDRDQSLIDAIYIRRLMHGVGNVIGTLMVVSGLYYFNSLSVSLAVIGFFTLLYPIFLYRKQLYYYTDLQMIDALSKRVFGVFGVAGFIYYNFIRRPRKQKWVEIKIENLERKSRISF